jgi:hypothetical protein
MIDEPIRQSRWKIVALVVLVFAIVTSPFTLVGIAFWAADGPWEFTGGGLRYWVFVKGSTVDRLSFVAATGRPSSYIVRLGEGTDPGEISVAYHSGALPGDIVSVYAERCRAIGLAVKKQAASADATEARLVCEGDRAAAWSDDVFVIAKHLAEGPITQVRIFAGPGLTATYDF